MGIENEADLKSTLTALGTLYRGLDALRAEFGNQPLRLRLLAEGPLDEIQRLEADLESYAAAFHSPSVTLWFTLIGGLARWAETPSRVLSGALDSLRKSIQSIALYDLVGRTDRRPTRALLEASDPELVLLKSGSLRIGLRWFHSGQTNLFRTEESAVAHALDSAVRAVRELDNRGVNALSDEEPNRRRVIFRAIASLAPSRRSDVEAIALSGPQIGPDEAMLLSVRTNELAKAAIREVLSPREAFYDGEIRELDLDRKTFYLRSVEDFGEIHCKARDVDFRRVREALDTQVRVFGAFESPPPRSAFLVTDLEPLEGSDI
jgi:hypothetical protein